MGAFLGLLRLSWEASGPQKHQKIEGFLRFLKMQLFGSLELLMALLGSSCPLLGPIWSQNGSKMGPKSGPKSDQKVVQKMTPKFTQKMPILGPQNPLDPARPGGPFWGLFRAFGQEGSRWRPDGPRGLQDAPRETQDRAKMAQDWAKMVPDRPKTGPRWPKKRPRQPKTSPK